jgi:phenylalanine-4-hydroxylase
VFFRPEWGTFDMAVGEEIVSAFAGPADPVAFNLEFPVPAEKTHHINHTENNIRLFGLYSSVNASRQNGGDNSTYTGTWEILKNEYPDEWLLPLEIAEELTKLNNTNGTLDEITGFLKTRSEENEELSKLIDDGLRLLTDQ